MDGRRKFKGALCNFLLVSFSDTSMNIFIALVHVST